MKINWRGLISWLSIAVVVFLSYLSFIADIAQVLTLEYGPLLILTLVIVAVMYVIIEQILEFKKRYENLKAMPRGVRAVVELSGHRYDVILKCMYTQWLLIQHGQHILVCAINTNQSSPEVCLDVSGIPEEFHDNLVGMNFAILIPGEIETLAQGEITHCTSTQAHLRLSTAAVPPALQVGHLAYPINPPDATPIEELMGKILLSVGE